MSIPKTTDVWYVEGQGQGLLRNVMKLKKDVPIPTLGDSECLVEIQAVSLNFRDVGIPKQLYPFPVSFPVIPCSDAAGVVIATGSKVTRFTHGDKVCTLFNQLHHAGPITPEAIMSGLGASLDGTLRQYAVFSENGLVRSPTKLSTMEASTLPCAPLTAWNCLFGLESKALKPGNIVLTQGTGGVSLSAIQFAIAAGATVIATTSSEEKAKKLQSLGAHHVINYKTTPNWGEAVKDLTPNKAGVDHVVEVGGSGTLRESLKAVKMDGVINLVGFLSGASDDQPALIECLHNSCIVRGIAVGSRQQFEAMNQAIDANDIHPILDEKHFQFDEATAAYEHLLEQRNYGKVVIRV